MGLTAFRRRHARIAAAEKAKKTVAQAPEAPVVTEQAAEPVSTPQAAPVAVAATVAAPFGARHDDRKRRR